MRRVASLSLALMLVTVSASEAQSLLGRSPNLRGEWPLAPWEGAFVFVHRFDIISGGDALINVPTLSLGFGLPAGLAAGIDFTSNSEIVPQRLGGNESQFWLSSGLLGSARAGVHGLAAYNHAARGMDAAVTGRLRLGDLSLLGEIRGFSNALGTGSGGAAAAAGAVFHVTPLLELSGDVGRMLSPDTLASVWSAGVAVGIPGTPHTLSLHATNSGALTLQGASRPKVLGPQAVRYGFSFTMPLGTGAQWARIFRRPQETVAVGSDTAAARVDMRLVAFAPREVRIRAGEAVEWINRDPVDHTATADDGSWGSTLLAEGDRYVRVFTEPGRYTYHCEPHPQMTGVVIVEAPGER